MTKWVYNFGDGKADGNTEMKNLLGGKGANLAEMSALGLPVPPGLTLTTEVCTHYTAHDSSYPQALKEQVADALAGVEAIMDLKFGEAGNALLLSVRSGARASMPGMMDTVLNLGLNDETVEGLAAASGDERFAFDSYRRFLQMYGDVVLGVEHHMFEDMLEDHKDRRGVHLDTELGAEDWRQLVDDYKAMIEKELGQPFPQDPYEQLWGAIDAVFGSWMNRRAKTYRALHNIPEEWGTAVNVQAMVFGNMGADCATGVAFTRDPANGENAYYGEYLINAQGEDVVAGIRTPQPLTIAGKHGAPEEAPAMEEAMPETFAELVRVRDQLEGHYKDMQDMEFTVQQGRLWMLQTRTGKRTTKAALKIAVDMVEEGLIDKAEAISRIDPGQLDQILHPTLDPQAERHVLAVGLPASPGAASGCVVFNSEDAEKWTERGEKVILVRVETSPEDIGGMHVARGIVTNRGGMTSHAAVVARGMGTPCVSGAGTLNIDYAGKTMTALGETIKEGDLITIDGTSGEVMKGAVATVQPEFSGDFSKLMQWVDETRTLGVRANAETPADASTAREFGAEGIGLCRTEHMFFDAERITLVRQMIVAGDEESRRAALDKLLPFQRQDFIDLFTIMEGQPVTIRLLDPPLHEFLPHSDDDMAKVAEAAGIDVATIRERAAQLHEFNPMLGHRGCRLGITYPEIYEMQARAIFEAAAEVTASGKSVHPEVMIPLVAIKEELDVLKALVDATAGKVNQEKRVKLDYSVGTMIELPRAALRAGEIAESAEFFSFGTNDLTQTALGLSRDDASKFIQIYREKGVLENDPFVTIDTQGVGELVRIAVERGRAARPDIKLGICGEHGGDAASVTFFHEAGLDYVSCSPYRVPIARLAAAQAALGIKAKDNA
ncbi:MAG: pyruvate, phosphate dikinase [Rhodospirillaceae bacterium]|jgi:pyruvate, orthophosphate dikinase|nr:pyruvate, phosphate dikinase [Rhodospirillaceae bacterium]MBT5244855.1 pyruvate, phosphate dikinase [Rhodospirillaceae bacterium]MBT5562235.1 pyruvate, phosphate dikinase [Rhodospirillaceae bacterium]MBT6242408.1 pyruvate, phosphate dikinase [Rhodospirillaceae bacterium]MBT7138903.1 pyruvate, phosphate dikinase [Rhodospirillaceae bacterium]